MDQRIRDIAFGVTAPQTVNEALEAVRYLEALKQEQILNETERRRAALQFEAGTGTLAHVHRVARNIPQYSTRVQIELERVARRQIGKTVRGLYHAIVDADQPVFYPPAPQTFQEELAAERKRRNAGRPATQPRS